MEPLDPEITCAVLDFAHCALDGEPVDMALDILKPRLGLVNFKSAYRARTSGPDEQEAVWQVVWTTARCGAYSWRAAVQALHSIGYKGDICLPAEYSRIGDSGQLMGEEVIPRLKLDMDYIARLLSETNAPPAITRSAHPETCAALQARNAMMILMPVAPGWSALTLVLLLSAVIQETLTSAGAL